MGMICYSYHWEALMRQERVWRGPSVVFQVHPVGLQIKRVLEEDRAKSGLSYLPEPEELTLSDADNGYIESLHNADGIIAASGFTRDGLVKAGVARDKISIVPYGGSHGEAGDTAPLPEARWKVQKPLRLLWVGQLTYRKGPHHLFDAVRRFPAELVEVSVVTRSAIDPQLAERVPENVRFYNSVQNTQLREMYRSHHLFVMPSLVEGFGLVYLEAMAEGLPILCTHNTGGPDVMEDGVEGFIVPPGEPNAIALAIERCLTDPHLLPLMSAAAWAAAGTWSWERFRQGIRSTIASFEQVSASREGGGHHAS